MANFGYTFATAAHLERMFEALNFRAVKDSSYANLLATFRFAMGLNRKFTTETIDLYFSSIGMVGTCLQLTDFCPFDFLKENEFASAFTSALIDGLADYAEVTESAFLAT